MEKVMKKAAEVVVIALATLGVLFLVLLFLPDDEEESGEPVNAQETVAAAEAQETPETAKPQEEETAAGTAPAEAAPAEAPAPEPVSEEISEAEPAPEAPSGPETTPPSGEQTMTGPVPAEGGNTREVVIPASEITDRTLRFGTTTLDEQKVTQEIFSDYDLTVVYVWGTYCPSCIREMGDYAQLTGELPDNVNLVGIVGDVYDGIETNVDQANKILKDAGAEYRNLRVSDDLYDIMREIQYLPSAFFADGDGHIIGEIMNGAKYPQVRKRLDGYLQ